MLGHKVNLSKLKKTEIISSIFSEHNAMRLEINCKRDFLGGPEVKNLPCNTGDTRLKVQELRFHIPRATKPMCHN